MNDNANRRRRGVWLGLLLLLLLALGGYGYAQSSSPSASAGPDKAKPSATPSVSVLAPTQTAQPKSSGSTGTTDLGTTSTGQALVLAPQASSNGNGNGNNQCVDPASENANCPHTFGVRVGQAPLLYPGVPRNLPVTFINPNNFAIKVTSYRVTVATSSTACPASNLAVVAGTVSLNPGLAIAKNDSTATTVPIKLIASAPDACQSVSFTITINASAVKK
jgi:hypothetical protein